jgi:hypothetical protein
MRNWLAALGLTPRKMGIMAEAPMVPCAAALAHVLRVNAGLAKP